MIRQKVGLVFQYPEYQLFEETVYKDICYGPMKMGMPECQGYNLSGKSKDVQSVSEEQAEEIQGGSSRG